MIRLLQRHDLVHQKRQLTLLLSIRIRGFLSEGKQVKRFEAELAARLGLVRPVALNSGTSALHLALVLAGVQRGEEVIIPPQTFIATGMAVLMQDATPVFADIQYRTGNIDPQSIRERIPIRR